MLGCSLKCCGMQARNTRMWLCAATLPFSTPSTSTSPRLRTFHIQASNSGATSLVCAVATRLNPPPAPFMAAATSRLSRTPTDVTLCQHDISQWAPAVSAQTPAASTSRVTADTPEDVVSAVREMLSAVQTHLDARLDGFSDRLMALERLTADLCPSGTVTAQQA